MGLRDSDPIGYKKVARTWGDRVVSERHGVEFYSCELCGALVTDWLRHDNWHDENYARHLGMEE